MQHLADDPAADRAEPVAVAARVGLAQDVEPERRLAAPAVLARPTRRRSGASAPIIRATASPDGQPDRLAALRVAHGERVVGVVVDLAGDRRRQVDQARGSRPSIALGALRRRPARHVEQQRPVDRALGRRAEADQVGEHRDSGPSALKR